MCLKLCPHFLFEGTFLATLFLFWAMGQLFAPIFDLLTQIKLIGKQRTLITALACASMLYSTRACAAPGRVI